MKNNLEELTKHAKKANLLDIGYFVANKKKFKTKLGTPKMLEPVNFLHSEQLFFTNYLFEDDAYKKIAHKLNNKNNQDKVEIQAIILSMYTRRYICENCQPTLLAFQFSNLFINNFLKAIEQEKLPISIKKNVLFFSTVSASVPFNYQNPKPEDKVPEHAHEAKIYKLNELHNGCLFLQNADLQAKKEDKVLFSGNKFTYKK